MTRATIEDEVLGLAPAAQALTTEASGRALQEMQTTGQLSRGWWLIPEVRKLVRELCSWFANSDMVPEAYRGNPDNVLVALSCGLPLGLQPLACLQSVAVVDGKPTLYGDAPPAIVLAHPSLVEFSESSTGTIEDGDRAWTVKIVRRMPNGALRTIERGYSVADAKRAKLWDRTSHNGKPMPWQTAPDRMLYNRARAFALRDSFADVLQGITLRADLFGDDEAETLRPADARIVPAGEAAAAPPPPPDAVTSTDDGFAAPAPKKRKSRHTKKSPAKPAFGDTHGGEHGLCVWVGAEGSEGAGGKEKLEAVLWRNLGDDDVTELEERCELHAELAEALKLWRELDADQRAGAQVVGGIDGDGEAERAAERAKDGRDQLDQVEADQHAGDVPLDVDEPPQKADEKPAAPPPTSPPPAQEPRTNPGTAAPASSTAPPVDVDRAPGQHAGAEPAPEQLPGDLPGWCTPVELDGVVATLSDLKGEAVPKLQVWLWTRPFGLGAVPKGGAGDIAYRLLPGKHREPQLLTWTGGSWSQEQPTEKLLELVRRAFGKAITEQVTELRPDTQEATNRALLAVRTAMPDAKFKGWHDVPTQGLVAARAYLAQAVSMKRAAAGGAK